MRYDPLINNNQPHAKTLLKISVFARLLIVHLRIDAAPCGLAPIRARPKIKPAKMPVEFLVVLGVQFASRIVGLLITCKYSVIIIWPSNVRNLEQIVAVFCLDTGLAHL